MEDLEEGAPGSPALQDTEEPQGNNDPRDPLNASEEEEDRPNAPLGEPLADVDAFDDNEAPETVAAMDNAADEGEVGGKASAAEDDDDDDDSELDELSEKEFEDFDESNLNLPEVPIQVDDSNVALLGVHKRQRTDDEDRERKKRKKEKRREKPKRSKRGGDGEDDFEGGVEMDGKRARKSKVGPDGRPVKSSRRANTPEDEEALSPEERRRRALDRKMDEALKTHRPVRRRVGNDSLNLEAFVDEEVAAMRTRVIDACAKDSAARGQGEVATHKLKILPDLVAFMNRNTIQSHVIDPDLNLLEGVRYMLEPAEQDAALPNYQIQRELFNVLGKLSLTKEALKASEIAKVALFYTKSTQPQPEIKRQAEKLIGEWLRIILNKEKTMRHRPVESKTYDPLAQRAPGASQANKAAAIAAEKRRRALAIPEPGNRARVEGGVGTYTIAPVNNMAGVASMSSRKMGAGGDEAFKRIAARGAAKAGGGSGARR